MSRANLKDPDMTAEAIGRIIVAAWFKAVPENATDQIAEMDAAELSAALSNILDVPCVAVLDKPNLINVVIPYPPKPTKAELRDYLHDEYQASNQMGNEKNPFNPRNKKKHGMGAPANPKRRTFSDDFGDTALFGCGR
jgi:hypothetical protein